MASMIATCSRLDRVATFGGIGVPVYWPRDVRRSAASQREGCPPPQLPVLLATSGGAAHAAAVQAAGQGGPAMNHSYRITANQPRGPRATPRSTIR